MIIQKMQSTFSNPVIYHADWLCENSLNSLIGKSLSIKFLGNFFCQVCQKKSKKLFGEAFCYSCFVSSAQASPCILKPELCLAHIGVGRDLDWEEKNHNQPHVVYLAATDTVKVGVTRKTQIPTRWIDQGASSVIIFAETSNRYEAGIIEVALKEFYTDKTNYKKMLQNEIDLNIDLVEEKWSTIDNLPSDLSQFVSENDEIVAFNYPVLNYPSSIQTFSLEKQNQFSGILQGIKGQYLIFDNNIVFNVRKHSGYEVQIEY
jgi:hypothetical protein